MAKYLMAQGINGLSTQKGDLLLLLLIYIKEIRERQRQALRAENRLIKVRKSSVGLCLRT